MEALLSTAFDNIASRDTARIRKGLRQIDGLLAQIVLAPAPSPASPGKGHTPSRASPGKAVHTPSRASPGKDLVLPSSPASPSRIPSRTPSRVHRKTGAVRARSELGRDAAFRAFVALQGSFEWNVATRLLEGLERVLGLGCGTVIDALLTSTLSLLLGTLLLHPDSAALFARTVNMNLLLDLLEASTPATIQLAALDILTLAGLERPANLRAFERAEGVQTLVSLVQASREDEVRLRVDAFWGVYLLPEHVLAGRAGGSCGSRSSLESASAGAAAAGGESLRSAEEKRAFLERCFDGYYHAGAPSSASPPAHGAVFV